MKKIRRFPFFKMLFGVMFLLFAVWVLSGKKTWFSDEPPLQFLSDMDDQEKIKPQVGTSYFSNRAGDREPLANTVARNNAHYTTSDDFTSPYRIGKTDLASAEAQNVNTNVPRNEMVVLRGQNRFNVMCSPCHGRSGEGDGPVAQKGFPKPPSLFAGAKGYSDARIFHVISAGQNIMPSYADKLSIEDRWAVVYYIRQMQGQITLDGKVPASNRNANIAPQPQTLPATDTAATQPISQAR
ncbi:MAG: cytochrome c [Bacteroidota bacterium]